MTRIGVKYREIRNLYVLVLFAPGSRRKIAACHVSRRPWAAPDAGQILNVDGRRVRIDAVVHRVERRGDVIEHITELFTRGRTRRAAPLPPNVVQMPTDDGNVVTQFVRMHVLIRVFDGDPEAWLEHLRAGGGDEGDLRFVRWIRSRMRHDPMLLAAIRRMVDAAPLRLSAGGGRL